VVDAERFSLCETCAGRQGDGAGFDLAEGSGCFICHGLTSSLASTERRIVREARRHQFETFSVGMILPAGVQEREDRLRSELRIRGRATIKSQLTGKIASFIQSELDKKVDRLHPDLTAVVDLATDTVNLTTKSIFVYGRYTKPRGLSQRRTVCERCNGRGCGACDGGYARTPSLEAVVDNRLVRLLGAQRTKFTWFGSEDPDSLVYPPGRPFVVEVKNPRKRKTPARLALRTGKGLAKISGLKVLKGRPSSIPSFTFETRAFIESETPVDPSALRSRRVKGTISVEYRNNKDKVVNKKVYRLRIRAKGKNMVAEIKLDGGLPVKRFVGGDSVYPSLSELLKTPLKCQRFDILRVWESGDLEFGKI
jgi:tRNA pseudouridine synthase 10